MEVEKSVMKAFSFFAFCMILLAASQVFAGPDIQSVNGPIEPKSSVAITGSGFGTGPNVRIFEDFETGINGELVSTSATFGAWSGFDTYRPYYIAENTGNLAGLLVDGDLNRQMKLDFVGVTEVFVSYRVRIPDGYNFPYTSTPQTFPSGSQWKLAWLMDGASGYMGDDDICLPSWPNGTYWMLGGNDNAFPANVENRWKTIEVGTPGTASNWFSFLGWNRVSVYLKGGHDPIVDNGIIWFEGMSDELGQHIFTWSDRPIFDGDDNIRDNDVSQWTRLNIPGWFRTGGTNVRAVYDDIYVATGPNSRARIEIGNAENYSNCTNLSICTPTAWSDTSITATINSGALLPGETRYVFVFDSNGNVNSTGYPIKMLSSEEEVPSTPKNFHILNQ